MSKPHDERQNDLFRPALDQIINLDHPLVRLAGTIDWEFLDQRFASVCRAGAGQPAVALAKAGDHGGHALRALCSPSS